MSQDHDKPDAEQPAMMVTPEGQGVIDPTASRSLTRRHMLMGGAMLAVAGATYARMPRSRFEKIPDEQFEAMFPKKFGQWHTLPVSELVMPPPSDLSDKLYQHILTRTYVNDDGVAIMFLAAYNSEQLNNVQVHRPEVCYAASGFQIRDSRPYDIDLGNGQSVPARMVKAERTVRTENILYWTRIGDDFPQSWLQQRIAMTKSNLEGFYADGLLIRASVIERDEEASAAVLSGFLRDLGQNSGPELRHIVFRT